MRTLKELLDVMDIGDPIADDELDFLIRKHKQLVTTLSEFGRKEYSLMYLDAVRNLDRLEGYKLARRSRKI